MVEDIALSNPQPRLESESRLREIDALRGLAALAVVLFHFTARISELYPMVGGPSIKFDKGHYGVNLFFIISGFVIFMTLERTRHGLDFLVSRFARLFPAYWLAIVLTFATTSIFGLPGKEVTLVQALSNVIMVHGYLRVPHVDGVYWTLEVELMFYAGMLMLFVTGQLRRVHQALWVLLALRLIWSVAARGFGIDLSYTLSRILILPYVPWFALGICIYQVTLGAARGNARYARITATASLICLVLVDDWMLALLALVLGAVVWAAALNRLRWLRHRVLIFFGTISYPLYLLHENIGWVVQRTVQGHGGSFDTSVVAALAVTIGLASAVTYIVEQPALRAIRGRYRKWRLQ